MRFGYPSSVGRTLGSVLVTGVLLACAAWAPAQVPPVVDPAGGSAPAGGAGDNEAAAPTEPDSANEAAKPDAADLETLVAGVEKFYDEVTGLQVEFQQTVVKKYRPKASAGTPRTGVAYFQRPGKMRWDYQAPEQVFYVSDGETLWVYEVEQNTAYKGKVKGSKLYDSMRFLFGGAKLRQSFIVDRGVDKDGAKSLILRPKEGQQAFRQLELLVDPKTFEIRSSRLTDPAGDESVIEFKSSKYGPIQNPEWFSWTPGEGVRVEDLSKRAP